MRPFLRDFLVAWIVQSIVITFWAFFHIGGLFVYYFYMLPLIVLGYFAPWLFAAALGNNNGPMAFVFIMMFPAALYAWMIALTISKIRHVNRRTPDF